MITTMTNASPIASQPLFIAFDWGTTTLRAYLVSQQGDVMDSRKSPMGILNPQNFAHTAAQICTDWDNLHGQLPRLASGMIGSKQGWLDAGYLSTPTSFDQIAKGALAVPNLVGQKFWIMPGITHRASLQQAPDVMRGEETQVFGSGLENGIAILPGTHSKWVNVQEGRIVHFKTYMTGETFSLFRQYSLLAKSMPDINASTNHLFEHQVFKKGVTAALSNPGDLLHQLFTTRTYGLFSEISGPAQVDYLSGLLIGSEISAARMTFLNEPGTVPNLLLIGEAALCERYQLALEISGLKSRLAQELVPAAVSGLFQIAKHLLSSNANHQSGA
jgi:2-dehydro-3-deoxygalactonokinase